MNNDVKQKLKQLHRKKSLDTFDEHRVICNLSKASEKSNIAVQCLYLPNYIDNS